MSGRKLTSGGSHPLLALILVEEWKLVERLRIASFQDSSWFNATKRKPKCPVPPHCPLRLQPKTQKGSRGGAATLGSSRH